MHPKTPYSAQKTRRGAMLQSAVPSGRPNISPFVAAGYMTKGVVINTYVYDSDGGAYAGPPDDSDLPRTLGLTPSEPRGSEINAVYCDVLSYGKYKGIIPRCLVKQDRGGLHEGGVWKPRPSSQDISGAALNIDFASNPADFSGDHVLVAFIEDDFGQPIIMGSVPHPNSDKGNEDRELGHRMRLTEADGEPRLVKHRGAFWGVDDKGNFTIDLTRAHTGTYDEEGNEAEPAEDGQSGNYDTKMPKGSTLRIKLGADHEIIFTESNGKLELKAQTVDVGTGASEAAIKGDFWRTEHASYDVSVSALFAIIAAVFPAMITDGIIGDPLTNPATNTAVLAVTAALGLQLPIIAGFSAKDHLSGSVKVKG